MTGLIDRVLEGKISSFLDNSCTRSSIRVNCWLMVCKFKFVKLFCFIILLFSLSATGFIKAVASKLIGLQLLLEEYSKAKETLGGCNDWMVFESVVVQVSYGTQTDN